MEYRILTGSDYGELEWEVREALSDGATLVGGPFISEGYQYYHICQAVMYPEPAPEQAEETKDES